MSESNVICKNLLVFERIAIDGENNLRNKIDAKTAHQRLHVDRLVSTFAIQIIDVLQEVVGDASEVVNEAPQFAARKMMRHCRAVCFPSGIVVEENRSTQIVVIHREWALAVEGIGV